MSKNQDRLFDFSLVFIVTLIAIKVIVALGWFDQSQQRDIMEAIGAAAVGALSVLIKWIAQELRSKVRKKQNEKGKES